MTIDDGIPVEEHEPLWLLIEWPFGESDPSKFAVTTLGTKMSKKQIVRQYKERYRTEQPRNDGHHPNGLHGHR